MLALFRLSPYPNEEAITVTIKSESSYQQAKSNNMHSCNDGRSVVTVDRFWIEMNMQTDDLA